MLRVVAFATVLAVPSQITTIAQVATISANGGRDVGNLESQKEGVVLEDEIEDGRDGFTYRD
jgi:hypothetical protein